MGIICTGGEMDVVPLELVADAEDVFVVKVKVDGIDVFIGGRLSRDLIVDAVLSVGVEAAD